MFQKPNKTVTEYYHRVDLQRCKIIEKLTAEVSPEVFIGRKLHIEETALSVFINGLRREMGAILRSQNLSHLSEAGRYAIQVDKIIKMNEARDKVFNIKTTIPHHHRKCIPNNQHQLRNIQRNNTIRSISHINNFCIYCKTHGHILSEYRKRAYKYLNNTNKILFDLKACEEFFFGQHTNTRSRYVFGTSLR